MHSIITLSFHPVNTVIDCILKLETLYVSHLLGPINSHHRYPIKKFDCESEILFSRVPFLIVSYTWYLQPMGEKEF